MPLDDPRVTHLSSALKAGPLLSGLLLARGFDTPASAAAFLAPSGDHLHDPMLLPDMALAVETIAGALDRGERILVHGDYDVDGIAACALLQRALIALGGEVQTHLPHRLLEGYGLSRAAIEKAAAEGLSLLLTADCGSGAAAEVAHAHSLGMRVVITDHHHPESRVQSRRSRVEGLEPGITPGPSTLDSRLSTSVAEVNPHRPDSLYPFLGLSGVGVAFKLVEALAARKRLPERAHWRFLDLVALGTVADVSPLVGENRFLVKEGLDLLSNSRKTGICALMKAAGLTAPVSSRQVAFVLAPRLNAAGRLAHPKEALHLLVTQDESEAQRLAENLCRHNRLRQEEESRTLKEALEMIDAGNFQEDKALVLDREGWHPGVIGIVASRLVEAFHRPVFMVALPDPESQRKFGVGSARAIPGFPLWEALHHCHHLLVRYGGHDQAAGFSVLPEKLPLLRERLCELAEQRLTGEDLRPRLQVEVLAKAAHLALPAVEELDRLEPFGAGNPSPTVAIQGLRVTEISRVGENGSHLRLRLHEPGGPVLRAIWFDRGAMAERLRIDQDVDLCLTPRVATWNGTKSVELRIQDAAISEDEG